MMARWHVRSLGLLSGLVATVMAVVLVAYFESGLADYVASRIPSFRLGEERRWAAQAEGNAHFEAGRYQEAIAVYDDLIHRAPDFKQAHAARGHALVAAQRYPDAIAAYTKAIEIDRGYPGPYLGRGWTRWFTRQVAAAADDCRQLVRLEPDNLDFRFELQRVLSDPGYGPERRSGRRRSSWSAPAASSVGAWETAGR